jgi:Uma2 family endonuclease
MNLADLDIDKTYTYADYLKWNFEERVELIKGKIFKMSPAPNNLHQSISMDISGQLWSFLKGKKCKVYAAPFDVRLPRKSKDDKDIITVVQPDIVVICDLSKLDGKGCIGAPDIVVEILSPSNNEKELNNKYEIYEQSGVKEYWVVFPTEKTVIIYKLTDGKFIGCRPLVAGQLITSPVLEGFSLSLSELFENLNG